MAGKGINNLLAKTAENAALAGTKQKADDLK